MFDPKEVNPQNLRPRNKHVILYRELAAPKSIVMPQNAAEAWKWTVVAISQGVEELSVGDSVWVTGKIGQDYAQIPGTQQLYIIAQENIMVIVGEERGERREHQYP
jgi:NADPH:quinone reductase-like Zn-dependent oxidoreductase